MTGARETSRGQVIDALRQHGLASRQDLVMATGLSRATLVKLLPDLIDSGLVVEDGGERVPRRARAGRRPVMLRLDPAAGAVLCVSFRAESIEVAVSDLSATMLAIRSTPMNVPITTAAEAFDCANDLIEDAFGASGVDPQCLVGVGLSIPAPVNHRTGSIVSPGILRGWHTTEPAQLIRPPLPLPVLIDNDCNLAALAELRFGAGRGREDFIYLLASGGIGSALVLNGRLYRGATGIAGELAHTVIDPNGPVCRCGNRGCLSASHDVLAQMMLLRPVLGDSLALNGIVRLIKERDRATLGVVRDAGTAIGRVLAGYCNELNPSAIVLGGELVTGQTPMIDAIRQAIDRFALPAISEAVELVPGELGEHAELIGAAALVIEDLERVPSSRLVALSRRANSIGSDPSSAVA